MHGIDDGFVTPIIAKGVEMPFMAQPKDYCNVPHKGRLTQKQKDKREFRKYNVIFVFFLFCLFILFFYFIYFAKQKKIAF